MNINNNSAHGTITQTQSTQDYICEYKPLTKKNCSAANCPRIMTASAWENLSRHCFYRQIRTR
ncbi:MAG: hypothetical protein IKW57_01625 [Alphaproteobacteria bacterium]|nr:hypothetical protein [Alphaproteobacteria bacterium]